MRLSHWTVVLFQARCSSFLFFLILSWTNSLPLACQWFGKALSPPGPCWWDKCHPKMDGWIQNIGVRSIPMLVHCGYLPSHRVRYHWTNGWISSFPRVLEMKVFGLAFEFEFAIPGKVKDALGCKDLGYWISIEDRSICYRLLSFDIPDAIPFLHLNMPVAHNAKCRPGNMMLGHKPVDDRINFYWYNLGWRCPRSSRVGEKRRQ